jgi:hypothetical protein
MKHLLLLAALFLVSLGADADTDAKALFDGATFTGWEGKLEWFRIEEQTIIAGTMEKPIPNNEFLCTTERYADFELTLEVKLTGKDANAGIQFRTERIPNHHEVSGYQADMGQHYWGCLYDESRRNKILAQPDKKTLRKALKPDDWNTYTIRAEGPRIQLWINGVQTVDYTEQEEGIAREGVIALQVHSGGPTEARYRNIRLKPLGESR